jgi:tetratricopeptide (TPR) repeat protein
MVQKHLDSRLLESLLRGEMAPAELRELAWHLVESCPGCARAVEAGPTTSEIEVDLSSTPAGEKEPEEQDGLVSFTRIRGRLDGTFALLARQRDEVATLLRELERHPLERQRILLGNNARFQTLPMVEALLERAWSLGFEDPEGAEAVAELAADLVDHLDAAPFGEAMLNDLRARSWAYRGNFYRIATDFRAADAAFRRAAALQQEGTGDLLEQARLLGLLATLHRDRSELHEARELLQKAVSIYVALEETHLAGRSRIEMGNLAFREQAFDQALQLFEQGLETIDAEQEPRLVLVAHHNMVLSLTYQGRLEEAMALLPKIRRLAVESGSRFDLLKLRWTEGNILLGLGHEARAEAAFLEVRKGFIEQRIPYDAASVTLSLAALFLRQGRLAELKQLAAEMLPIFQSRDVHQEAIAALLLFQRAVDLETLTLRVVEEVSEVVRHSQAKPSPRSEVPS